MVSSYEERGSSVTVSLINSNDEVDVKTCLKLLESGRLSAEAQAKILKMALLELKNTAVPTEYKKLRKALSDKDRKIKSLEGQLNKLKGIKAGKKAEKRGDSFKKRQKEQALEEEIILANEEDYKDEIAEFAASLEKLA